MPTLNWIGKKAVENHHREVPFRLLKDVPDLSVGAPGTGNLIVEGDNLSALKALLPYYAGQVKCIYIDPPYNTGNEKWVYNDAVNSPEMRDWLGKVVGNESEDLTRHDKWLCMMYPRLCLLREMLREDGAIFISIDDIEVAKLRLIADEIFGGQNFVINLIWEKKFSPQNDEKFVTASHDHILVYARDKQILTINPLPRSDSANARFENPDNDQRGVWSSGDLTSKTKAQNHSYEIISPSGKRFLPPRGRQWAPSFGTFQQLFQDNRIWFGKNGGCVPRQKQFLNEVKEGIVPMSIWEHVEVGHTQEAKQEMLSVIGRRVDFETPKPTRLIKRILQMVSDEHSIVLDSFAGSGTTGHAVMEINKEDGGDRKFILVEMDPKIARDITTERVKRVALGYTNAKGERVEGLGGGFRYVTLGEPLFDEKGNIRSTVKFAELARHVYFTETGETLPKQAKANTPLIGICNGLAIYLLYNGILKDKTPDGGNVLTANVLAHLPKHNGPKVIYGTACRVGPARLRKLNITFKQLPYKLKVDAL